MKKNRLIIILMLAIFYLFTSSGSICATELPSGEYFTLINENNQLIHQTGLIVNIGD